MKLKDVEFDMKYIGWDMGQYGRERHQIASMAFIEILELKIDDVDILKELAKLEAVKNWYQRNNQSFVVDWDDLSDTLKDQSSDNTAEAL